MSQSNLKNSDIEQAVERDFIDRTFPYLLYSIPVIVIVGTIMLTGKGIYGSFNASQNEIAEAAKDECMKERILSFKEANTPIRKSFLWDFEMECDLKNQ